MKSHLHTEGHQVASRPPYSRHLPRPSTIALAISLLFPAVTHAAVYFASDADGIGAAIAAANASGDTNAVIKLTADASVTFGTTLVTPNSPVTIDTNGHTLFQTATPTVTWALTMPNQYTFRGDFEGVSSATPGSGLFFSTTSLSGNPALRTAIIEGNMTGGAHTSGGAGGAGVTLSQGAKTLINNGTITGGEGGSSGGSGVAMAIANALVNTGTILGGNATAGTGGAGVGFGATTTSSIINSGTIRGGSGTTAGGAGIRTTNVTALLTIQNTGTIEGGAGGAAIDVQGANAVVKVINSSAITAGAGADAITFGTTGTSTLELRAGSVITGDVVAGSGINDTLTFGGNANASFNAADIGVQYLGFDQFSKIGSSTWTLTGTSGSTGPWTVEEGKLVLNGSLTGPMTVNAAGTLGGNGTVTGDVTNSGTIAPGNSIGTFLVNGNYIGNGGTLEMEGQFGGTGSPADRLLVTGNATGTTTINAINVGGTGALTGSGNTDGISIVQVAGTSSASAFQLAGGYVAAGPYQYKLSMFDPASSAASEVDPLLGAVPFYDYRLQSLVDASGQAVTVPQIGAYQGMSTGAVRYGASLLDSVHKRLGELRRASLAGNGSDGQNSEFFLRAQGSRSDVSGSRSAGYDQDIWFTQAGGNIFGKDMGDGSTLRIGGAFSYGESKLNVDHSSANVNLDGTTLALTTTYQSAIGWYLDGVAQVTRYSADIHTSERGQTGSPDGLGYALSVEGGHTLYLGENLTIEPQVQLSYQKIKFDRFTDVDNISVDLRDGESLRGRFGTRIQRTLNAGTTRVWSPYVEANLLHEFLGDGSIRAADVSFATDSLGTSLQLGGGINAQLGANKMFFASVSYESGLSDAAADAWSGNVGMRIDF